MNAHLTEIQKVEYAIRAEREAETRDILKSKKRFKKFFQNLPVRLSKANVREMTIAALCTAAALKRPGMPEKERLEAAEEAVLRAAFEFYKDERRQRQAPRSKAA